MKALSGAYVGRGSPCMQSACLLRDCLSMSFMRGKVPGHDNTPLSVHTNKCSIENPMCRWARTGTLFRERKVIQMHTKMRMHVWTCCVELVRADMTHYISARACRAVQCTQMRCATWVNTGMLCCTNARTSIRAMQAQGHGAPSKETCTPTCKGWSPTHALCLACLLVAPQKPFHLIVYKTSIYSGTKAINSLILCFGFPMRSGLKV